MKTIDEVVSALDRVMIKKTGHRLTQDEVDLIKYGCKMAIAVEQSACTVRPKRAAQQKKAKITCCLCGSPCVRIYGESVWVECSKCGELHRK